MTRREANPWLVLTGLSLGVLVTNGFGRFAYGLILPAMRADLDWSYAQAGWLNTANALGYIAGAVGTMLALRRMAPARLFAIGLAVTALSLVATGLVPALWWQSLWRFLTGLFGALSFSTAGALAARLWAEDPRRNALGIGILFGSGGGSAIVLCGATLPAMLSGWGDAAWPWAWLIVGGLSLACLPLGLWAAWRAPVVPRRKADAPPLPLAAMTAQFVGYAGFGLGYIVYLTFLSSWMREQAAGTLQVALVWILLGGCITLSPLLWRGIFARHASGRPLALVLCAIAAGSALPVLWPGVAGLVVSATIFGLSVFMAPPAITNFTRQNLPAESWGSAISLFTVIFAVAQTVGPYAAGWLGDRTGSIGPSLLAAAALLLLGALAASRQKAL
ncbi:YbfB/YjiJ family MFS transporter [Rhodobacter sp. NTK016B]|uniref:YbfB/YjiJ family MFS transporter n=1 Tax=Rhodobacter sp. NTK016B TaxID=2759676 RepID=UPI001A908659|nr:YbfB/YjiJ family MFS transporter [Rhodobacter sp. NTK016B]MBN8294259.1 YbfB/YjiJ family MFS transporter [Rhodobacter sp. NTK016B]